MSDRSYSTEDVAKLKKLFTEGLRVMREMEDLREGLKDTVKSIAEEMDIKPAVLTENNWYHVMHMCRNIRKKMDDPQ